MIKKSEILEKIEAVRSAQLSAWDFYRWIDDSSWNLHRNADLEAAELIGAVKFIFEDYYEGRLEESDVVAEISKLREPNYGSEVAPNNQWIESSAHFHGSIQGLVIPHLRVSGYEWAPFDFPKRIFSAPQGGSTQVAQPGKVFRVQSSPARSSVVLRSDRLVSSPAVAGPALQPA